MPSMDFFWCFWLPDCFETWEKLYNTGVMSGVFGKYLDEVRVNWEKSGLFGKKACLNSLEIGVIINDE